MQTALNHRDSLYFGYFWCLTIVFCFSGNISTSRIVKECNAGSRRLSFEMYVLSLPQAGHILGDSGYRPVLINFANECLGMSRHWHFLSLYFAQVSSCEPVFSLNQIQCSCDTVWACDILWYLVISCQGVTRGVAGYPVCGVHKRSASCVAALCIFPCGLCVDLTMNFGDAHRPTEASDPSDHDGPWWGWVEGEPQCNESTAKICQVYSIIPYYNTLLYFIRSYLIIISYCIFSYLFKYYYVLLHPILCVNTLQHSHQQCIKWYLLTCCKAANMKRWD